MEGGRVGNGVFLPGPRAGLEREGGEVEELRQLEKGSAPNGRVVKERLGEVPSGTSHDEEVVVAHVAVPDLGVVGLEKVEEAEAVFGAGVVFRAVEIA